MISLLVSSKTMSPRVSTLDIGSSKPELIAFAQILHRQLESLERKKLQTLMHISEPLAEKTKVYISDWKPANGTPAWLTFVGDVYKGLKIDEFTTDDLMFAQQHCATLSGLYGLLRPLDLIHPYRLELGYKLSGKGYKNLYEFWGDKVADLLPKDEPVINLASDEYIKVVQPYLKPDQLITPWFMEIKNGEPEFQAIHAKTARGAMARWICKNRVDEPEQLKSFGEDRYQYSVELSTKNKPTFVREFIPIALQRSSPL